MKVNSIKIAECIKKMEVDLNLLKSHDDYIRYSWEALRFTVGNLLIKEIRETEERISFKRKTGMIYTIKNIIKNTSRFYWKGLFNKKKYLVLANSRRLINVDDNVYDDPYTEDLVEYLGISETLILEDPQDWNHSGPTRNKVYYNDIIHIIIGLLKFVCWSYPKTLSNIGTDISNYINDELGFVLPIEDLLISKYKYLKRSVFINKHLLKFLKPEKIFLVCSYGREPIIIAAKELKIETNEIQHGVITNNHLGYSFSKGGEKKSFVDNLLLFGNAWKDSCDFTIKKENLKVFGYPFLTNKLVGLKKVEKKNQIVFLSQWTIGKQLVELVIEFSKIFDSKIIYKLHPVEISNWKEIYPELACLANKGRVEVIGKERSLHELLAESKWQVGVYSTALYEGLAFGCETFLANFSGVEEMDFLIKNNYALLFNHPEEIDLALTNNKELSDDIFNYEWKMALDQFFNV